ncbi:hypothetical protein C2G38_2153187 [Gigaspora rosea]|uniref:Uncharacterized protein n=1 Tax=Gigaspora rosea TaxID=44941 RepID=A0A397W9C3_9GLOM|nr:hypothetical protein C2G38_2153187 [Gigaspora rosea]
MLNSKINNEHFSQLFQSIVNVLVHSQKPQVEIDLVKIPTFIGGNQDPIEWLDLINQVFEANNILGIRRLIVAGTHLSVKGLCPDLSLFIQQFIPSTLQEAIERTEICELIIVYNLTLCGPAVAHNTASNMRKVEYSLYKTRHQNKRNKHGNKNQKEKEEETKPVDFSTIKHKKDTPDYQNGIGIKKGKNEMSNNNELAPTFFGSFYCHKNEFGVEKKGCNAPNIHQKSKRTDCENRTRDLIRCYQNGIKDRKCLANNLINKVKIGRVERMNNLGSSYQNGIRIEKYEPKTFNNYQKPTNMGRERTTLVEEEKHKKGY